MTILPNTEKAQGGMLKRGEVQQIFQMLRREILTGRTIRLLWIYVTCVALSYHQILG